MGHKISLVIANYNGIELLKRNLSKIILSTYSFDPNAEVIIVDDGSKDGSATYIKKNFSRVKLIQLSENRGFSYAMNIGIKHASGDLVVLLNTDVTPEKGYLNNAVKHFSDNAVFAVSFHERGFGWARGFFNDGFVNHVGVINDNKLHETFWVNGGSGIFRKNYLKKLGYFDDELFSPFYWEDIDLSYRGAKRGWKLLWEPDARVLHYHGSTINKISKNKRDFIVQRNQLFFIWKNITSPILFRKHMLGLLRRIIKNPGYIKVFLIAMLKVRTVLSERAKEKKESTVSDETIFLKFSR